MENKNLFEVDYYIYVYFNRIVRIVKSRKIYNSIKISGVSCYITNYVPTNVDTEDLIYNYSYSPSNDKEFYIPEDLELSEETKIKMRRMTSKIVILEQFENSASLLTESIIKRTTDEDIYNRIIMKEIENYEKTNDIGVLLEAEFKCSKFKTYDSLVESIKLKYNDAAEILAYIKYKSFEIRNLLAENEFAKAYDLIKFINQKIGM
jgi:hypothetical protein